MASPQKFKQLHIHTTQGYAGTLTRESQIIFNYQVDDKQCEIGLTMPLTKQSHASNILPGVLRQNLPEGFLLNWIKEHYGKTMKLDDFNMLALIGKDMIGRVRCSLDAGDASMPAQPEVLSEILTWKGSEDLFEYLSQKYAATSGVSGVQPKVLVPAKIDNGASIVEKSMIKDKHLIIKAGGADWPELAENEYFCMSIAKQAELSTPAFWLAENKEVFIVERFDIDNQGNYLGFEDMTALTGKQDKYESSYEIVAKAVDHFVSPQFKTKSFTELFKSIVLSIVVRNGDAHLKNFGLIYTTPETDDVRLSPLYDVVNTTCYLPRDILALKMNKTKAWPTRETLIAFGQQHCKIDRPEQIIDHIIEVAASYTPDIEVGANWKKVREMIDVGCMSVSAPKQFPVRQPEEEDIDAGNTERPSSM